MMFTLLTVFIFSIVNAELIGPVTITENGQKVTRYVVAGWSGAGNVNGSSIIVNYDGNIQIAMNASSEYTPDMFVEYKLKVIYT